MLLELAYETTEEVLQIDLHILEEEVLQDLQQLLEESLDQIIMAHDLQTQGL